MEDSERPAEREDTGKPEMTVTEAFMTSGKVVVEDDDEPD